MSSADLEKMGICPMHHKIHYLNSDFDSCLAYVGQEVSFEDYVLEEKDLEDI